MTASPSLVDDLLCRPGAVPTQRHGCTTVAHFGSSATEVAVCCATVGLADRSDLAVLSITGHARTLERLVARMLGARAPRVGTVRHGDEWWHRSGAGDEIVVVCPGSRAERMQRTIRELVTRPAGATLTDLSDSHHVIHLLGRYGGAVAGELGVLGELDLRGGTLERPRATLWMIEGPHSMLAVVPADEARALWRALEQAGRPYGITPVGTDAIDRYLIGHALATDPHRTPQNDQRARMDAASTISSTQLSTLMRVEFKTRS